MATLPSFRTWSTGEVVRASYFNGNVRDAGNFFVSVPTLECRQTIVQSIPDFGGTTLTFDTNDIDTDEGHSTTINNTAYFANTAGRFQVQGAVSLAAHADTNARQIEIDRNGGSLEGSDVCQVGFGAAAIRLETRLKLVFLNVFDFVEISVFETSGAGSLNTVVSPVGTQPSMSIRWVGSV